jgi:uncharacterized phage protein (TIGR02218 family)
MAYEALETSVHEGQPIECFHFTRGGQEWFLTSADVEVVLPEIGTFEPEAVLAGGQELREEDDKGGIEIQLPRTSPIVEPYIPFYPSDRTWLRIYRGHRGDEASAICVFFGSIDSVALREGSIARVQCASLLGGLVRRVPGLAYTVQCNRALYGPGCDVDPDDYRDSVAVMTVSGSTLTAPAFNDREDGWYTGGWIERSSGERRFVVSHVGPTVQLMSPFQGLASYEVVSAYAGCNLTRAMCIARFNNAANFLGFEWVPWRDPHKKRVG